MAVRNNYGHIQDPIDRINEALNDTRDRMMAEIHALVCKESGYGPDATPARPKHQPSIPSGDPFSERQPNRRE